MRRLLPLIALALMAQAPEPTPTPPPATAEEEREITVIGRKSAWWRGSWLNQDGDIACTIDVGTGDAEFDKIMCDGLIVCGPRFVPEMQSVVRAREAVGYTTTRNKIAQLMKPVNAKIKRCMRGISRPPFLALIRARKAARK